MKLTHHEESPNLISGFYKSLHNFPDQPCLSISKKEYSYSEIGSKAAQLYNLIQKIAENEEQLVGIFANRDLASYIAIIGILSTGKGYLPLNPKHPAKRIQSILSDTQVKTIITNKANIETLMSNLKTFNKTMKIVCLDDSTSLTGTPNKKHKYYFQKDLSSLPKEQDPTQPDPNSIAYLLFTSGSTGKPKGIPINHINGRAYLNNMANYYPLCPTDRVSQTSDLTFDFSIQSIFTTWDAGACLVSFLPEEILFSAKIIQEQKISVWISVPSLPMYLKNAGILKPKIFPSVRYSFFCGEALKVNIAESWLDACSNGEAINLYGPTEATVEIFHYKVTKTTKLEAKNNVVPIGRPFEDQRYCIVTESLKSTPNGYPGELCLSGTQVANGYFRDPERTALSFVHLPMNSREVWYRTGDLVLEDEQGCLHFLNRVDFQVKIRGHRIELQEIDYVLQKVTSCTMAVTLPWPIREGIADGVISFLSGNIDLSESEIIKKCSELLPFYMLPAKIITIEEFPLNTNGKVDRKKLTELLSSK